MKKLFKESGVINALLSIAIFFFLFGCEKDDSGPKITDVNGNWSGKTNQNENVTFSVATNSVSVFSIKVITPSFTQETSLWPSDCPVTANSFSLSGGDSPTLYITGKFESNTTSKGTFSLGSTSGTWTATKQ